MKKTIVVAVLATCAVHATAETPESLQDRTRAFDQLMVSAEQPSVGTPPNTCGAAPLPLTPQGPVIQAALQYGSSGDPINVTAWRYPCSASASMVVLTLNPTPGTNPSFICQPRFLLLQSGGLQTTAFNVKNDPLPISSFCSTVVAPVTVAFVPTSQTPTSFDFDQAMTIDYDGSSAGHQTIAIAAYNPALYNLTPPPGPDAVKVHVRGSGSSYRNCTISSTPIGGGSQYTATCDSETPLKVGAFDKYNR